MKKPRRILDDSDDANVHAKAKDSSKNSVQKERRTNSVEKENVLKHPAKCLCLDCLLRNQPASPR